MLEQELQKQLIERGREASRGFREDDPYEEDFESDQDLKRPQPPLCKPPMAEERARVALPRDFSGLERKEGLESLLRRRRSARVYTQAPLCLGELSFLLWATQGVRGLRGKSYATLRTVPSGGARHPFETYLAVRNVEGLEPGLYHYLPLEHALEFLGPVEGLEEAVSQSLCGQEWAAKGAVVFYWSMVAYRAEWRYGIYAHRIALLDAGHVGENLYLACAALGLGTCAIAAFSHEDCARLLGLDGEEEYVVYAAPVGGVRPQDAAEEQAFYRFLEEEEG